MGSLTLATWFIVAILLLILASLGVGLFFLIFGQRRDGQSGKRTFWALTVRVGLAMLLFVLLAAAVYFNVITLNPAPI